MKILVLLLLMLILVYYFFLYLRYRKYTRGDIHEVDTEKVEVLGKSKFNLEDFQNETFLQSDGTDASSMFEIVYEEKEEIDNGITFEEMQMAVDVIQSEKTDELQEIEAGEVLAKLRGTEIMLSLVEQMEDSKDRISRLMDNYIGNKEDDENF